MKFNRVIVILCLLCVGVYGAFGAMVKSVSASDWPSSGNDIQRTRNTAEQLSDTFSQQWRYAGSAEIIASPVVADGLVIMAGRDGYVRALRESDSSSLWAFQAGAEIISSPTVYNGRVYVAANERIHCLRLSDGIPLWDYVTSGTDLSSPIVVSNTLYVGSGYPNQKLIAIDITNPITPVWQKDLGQIVQSSAAVSGTTLVIGANSGIYYALNKDTNADIWSYNANGDVMLSSPLIIGNSVYLLPGGTGSGSMKFYRVDMDSANWGTDNWDVTLTDPAEPISTILGAKLATSSPVQAGNLITFVVRFDYSIDNDADDIADEYVLNEYLIAINPATHLAAWQVALGAQTVASQNDIPTLSLCPSPAGLQTASGQVLATASSLTGQLTIISPADGSTINTYPLDSATQASLAVANGKVFVATKNGSVYAFQNNVNNAPSAPAAGFAPATVVVSATVVTPTVSWSPASDANDGSSTLKYLIRVDDDGEVLENYDFEYTTSAGVTSVTIAPVTIITDTLTLTYAVRTIDPSGAYSRWSDLQSFDIRLDTTPPEGVTNLRATPSNGYVDLFWAASGSDDVNGYLVTYKESTASGFAPLQSVGNLLNYRVNGLANGIPYIFRVLAQDNAGWLSVPAEISAVPNYMVFINGAPYDSISAALVIANSGDTITIAAGTFVLQNTLFVKEGVNITGAAPHLTIIDAANNLNTVIELSGSTALTRGTIANLTVQGGFVGIDASGHAVIIKNTVIKNNTFGVLGDGLSNIDVINNTIIYNSESGIYVGGPTVARNNIIIGNQYGIRWSGIEADLNKLSISYNNVYGNGLNYVDCSPGAGDLSQNVVFEDEANNDYREVAGSETVDMGNPTDDWALEPEPNGGRINMGAFGNTIYATTSQNSGSSVKYNGMNKGCFIATAVYGNYNHPNVMVLRNFRDRYLVTNAPGRYFVRWYYRVSPPIAEYLKTAPLKAGMVRLVLTPVVYVIKYPSIITTIILLLVSIMLINRRGIKENTNQTNTANKTN